MAKIGARKKCKHKETGCIKCKFLIFDVFWREKLNEERKLWMVQSGQLKGNERICVKFSLVISLYVCK